LYQNGTTKNLTYLQAKRDVLRNRSDVKEEQLEQFPEYYETERTCKVCDKTKVTAIKRQFDDLKGHTRVICFECANTPTCHNHGYNIRGKSVDDTAGENCAFCGNYSLTTLCKFTCRNNDCNRFLCDNCSREPTYKDTGYTLLDEEKVQPEGWSCQL
jgi:hypothetical protein